MFVYFFSLTVIFFEVICCKLFFESFCEIPKGKKKIKIFLLAVLVSLFYLCGLFLSDWFVVKQAMAIIIITFIMQFYFNITIKKAAFFAMLYQGILLLIDYLVYIGNTSIISQAGEVYHEYIVEGNLAIIFSKSVLFLCILLLRKQFGKKTTEILSDAVWIKLLFFPVFTIITITAMLITFQYTENQSQMYTLETIALGMVIMNVFVYYLINDIVIREAKLHEKEILELQVKDQIKMYRSISENYEVQKHKAHEFKNHVLCIETLLQEEKYSEVNSYISKIRDSFINERNVINTNHTIINAILNAKYQEAVKKNIVFAFRVNDLSQIEVEDEDLVVMLANLLNNAIEACERCENRKIIKFKFMIEDNTVILSVKNTYHTPPVYENNEFKTSKTVMSDEHGVGIKNIVRIIEKYRGEYVIQYDREFYFSILIPMTKNTH